MWPDQGQRSSVSLARRSSCPFAEHVTPLKKPRYAGLFYGRYSYVVSTGRLFKAHHITELLVSHTTTVVIKIDPPSTLFNPRGVWGHAPTIKGPGTGRSAAKCRHSRCGAVNELNRARSPVFYGAVFGLRSGDRERGDVSNLSVPIPDHHDGHGGRVAPGDGHHRALLVEAGDMPGEVAVLIQGRALLAPRAEAQRLRQVISYQHGGGQLVLEGYRP